MEGEPADPASPGSSGQGDLPPIQCGLLLTLPAHLEAEWEHSECMSRVFTLCDSLACSYSILINTVLLLWDFRTNMWHVWLKVLLVMYIVASAWQLALLTRQPSCYLCYRMRINAVNRLARMLMLASKLLVYSPSVVHMLASEACATGIKGSRNSSGAWHDVLMVVRPIFGPLMAYAAHANFLLPFRYVLPLQLVTLALSLHLARGLACWFVTAPGMEQLTIWFCSKVHIAMHAGKLLHTGAREAWEPSDVGVCRTGTAAVTLLIMYANVVMLLMLPCVVVFQLEHSHKDRFARQTKKRLLSRTWPNSAMSMVVVLYTALVASWYICTQVVSRLSVKCQGGWLALA